MCAMITALMIGKFTTNRTIASRVGAGLGLTILNWLRWQKMRSTLFTKLICLRALTASTARKLEAAAIGRLVLSEKFLIISIQSMSTTTRQIFLTTPAKYAAG